MSRKGVVSLPGREIESHLVERAGRSRKESDAARGTIREIRRLAAELSDPGEGEVRRAQRREQDFRDSCPSSPLDLERDNRVGAPRRHEPGSKARTRKRARD
jgi:hypothetical protein